MANGSISRWTDAQKADMRICGTEEDQLHEECGVFGVFSPETTSVAQTAYYGLFALQHRGQEGCGITVNDDGVLHTYKDLGLLNDVFTADVLERLGQGNMAIGHVRYGTTGGRSRENCQPMQVNHVKGVMSLVHNGNLTNAAVLRRKLELKGSIFHTTSDTEVIAYEITRERIKHPSIEAAIEAAVDQIDGAFSLIIMSPGKMIAVRDKHGFRPLCYGVRNDGSYIIASESCALAAVGAHFVRDVEPGEILVFDRTLFDKADGPEGLKKAGGPEGGKSRTIQVSDCGSKESSSANASVCSLREPRSIRTYCGKSERTLCVFEYIYFARSDSVIDGVSVQAARLKAGEFLAKAHPVDADIVVGVPDSGLDAALGYARASGIPFGLGFIKNKYIGRTFIEPGQSVREDKVRIKLNPVEAAVKGKRVVLIDDSIVRGTTSKRIISLLKEAGAAEVHMRISAPPFRNPCFYGTDVDSREHLIACNHSIEEIAEIIGADTLEYLSIEDAKKIAVAEQGESEAFAEKTENPECSRCGFCTACFNGDYPTEIPDENAKSRFEKKIHG